MPVLSMELRHTPGRPRAGLREICGRDELTLSRADTRNVLDLLDRLLELDGPTSKANLSADQIVTTDRDQLLAQMYLDIFGPNIESTMHCTSCKEPFDIDFSLPDLMAFTSTQHQPEGAILLEDNTYQLGEKCRFRLPTGADELSLQGVPPEQAEAHLLERCLLQGSLEKYGVKVQEAMATIAPMLQMEIQVQCPECRQEQSLRFDVQSFLLERLLANQKIVSWEVHQLASHYHWSHEEILNIPRRLRKMYLAWITAE